MMVLKASIFTVIAGTVAASTISIYPATGCGGNHAICKNVKKLQCCHYTNGQSFRSAYFQIASNAVGGTFTSNQQYLCNDYTASREGPGCVTSAVSVQGAGFTCCVTPKKKDSFNLLDEYSCTETVLADIAVIGGHYFDMGSHVPADAVLQLSNLIASDATYEDVPASLKVHERGQL